MLPKPCVGAVTGAAGAVAGAPIQGLGNMAYFGDPYSGRQYATDILLGGVMGGIAGGIHAKFNGKNFWNGNLPRPSITGGQGVGRITNQGSRVEIGEATGEFPAITNSKGEVKQTIFIAGRGNSTVQTYYPPNGGAYGNWSSTVLQKGQVIDRFGDLRGSYFSPSNTPVQMRSLPPNADLSKYTQFEVLKSFHVQQSQISPAFGQIGGGIQFKSYVSVEDLIKGGVIKQIK